MATRCSSVLAWQSILSIAVVLCAVPALAQPSADSIDRPISIYVAGTAGGGIDLYARMVGRHLGKHIAGHPLVNVQVMPGAGGIRAAKFLADQAPRDGTAMTTFANGPVLEPLIGAHDPGYDMSKFTMIGAVTKDIGLCMTLGTTPIKTIEDAKKQQVVVAGTGAGSETDTWPIVLNEVLGTKFKLVTGYLGTKETIIAIERGEAEGRCVFSVSAIKTSKPEWMGDHKINVLVQLGLEKAPEFPDAPLIFDLVSKQEDRQLIEMMVGPGAMARPFAAPPGLPSNKAALLRRGFDATMKDPEFLAEAEKIKADIKPTTGEEVQKLVGRIYGTPKPVVERVKKFFTQ